MFGIEVLFDTRHCYAHVPTMFCYEGTENMAIIIDAVTCKAQSQFLFYDYGNVKVNLIDRSLSIAESE